MSAAVTPIRPEFAMAEVTRWRKLLDTTGARWTSSWDALFTEFSRVVPFRGDEHPGWSAAIFENDQRLRDGVRGVTAAVLDYDGTATLEQGRASWGEHLGFLHTSKKHTTEAPRFRVILPLRRPVSAFEWGILWARLNDHANGALDGQAKDASRFWYTPGIVEGGEFHSERFDGPMLDPDEWLRKNPKAQPQVFVGSTRPYRDPGSAPDVEDRVQKYVAKMPGAVSRQAGHLATWKVALVSARGFALDEEATMRVLRLFNERCEPHWTESELRHKANDAVNDARVPLGYKLGDERQRRELPPPPMTPPPEVNEDGEVVGWEPEPELIDPEAPVEEKAAKSPRTMAEMLGGVLERAQSGAREPGIDTCHYQLEHMLAGFRPKMITVLGARTSFGKSSYAIMVADEAMRKGHGVLLISVEDSEETYAQRFMSRRAKVSAYDLRANECNAEAIQRMAQQVRYAQSVPFFVDAVGVPAEGIAATITRECGARPVKLVIVDYLQRIGTTKRTQDKRTEITHAMGCITDAIKKAGAAGLVLSQLKRLGEGSVNKEPNMSDLKESGDIENMAEHVVLGWLVEEPQGDAEPVRKRWLKVEKNKDGPVDTRGMAIGFDEETASFRVSKGDMPRPVATDLGSDFEPGDAWHP